MQRVNSLLSAGVTLTSTGTAVASPIPFDSSGYFPRFVRVVASGAGCYVKVGDIGVTAVSGDCLIQPLDGVVLNVAGCKAISAISVSGTSSVTVVPLERGSWNYDQRTLDYNFTTLSAVPSPVTYTGGSSRTFFGSDGLLKVQGYNLLTYSQDLTNAAWVKSGGEGVTISADAVVAPDGTLTADKVSVLASTGTGANVAANSTSSVSSGSTYTASVYLKAAELSYAHLVLIAGFPTTALSVNLSTGATSIANGTGTPLTPACTDAGNGWWRVSFSLAATSTTAVANLSVYLSQDGLWSSRAAVKPLGAGIYLWGAQLEAGSTASQYSPTTTAANSAPRLDYDPATLLPRGLLVEEQRVNLLLQSVLPAGTAGTVGSGAVAPTSWTFGFTGATVSFPSSRFGTNGVRFATTGATRSYIAQTVSVSASTTYVLSALVDTVYGGSLSIQQAISYATMPAGATQTYSKNGTAVSGATTFTTGDVIAAVMVVSTTAGTAECRVGAGCVGDGTSGDYSFTTPQCEAGAFKTSYIPTTTASATRSADSALMTGTNFSSWYSQAQGTFVAEFSLNPQPAGLFPIVSQVDDGTANNRIQNFAATAASTFVAGVSANSGGANQVNNTAATTSGYSVAAKSAYRYALNDYAFVTNGGAVSTDTSALLPVAVDRIRLGANQVGLSVINGHIRRLQFYPVALPSATLTTLTA